MEPETYEQEKKTDVGRLEVWLASDNAGDATQMEAGKTRVCCS
jgi:hypothetical protein